MSSVPHPAQERVYPLAPPDDDRRFTLGLIFTLAKVLENAGYPAVRSGPDLATFQQVIYGFLYAPPQAHAQSAAERLLDETRRRWAADHQAWLQRFQVALDEPTAGGAR